MKRLYLALCGLLLSGLAVAQDAPALLVQADQSLGLISPCVYGSTFGVYSADPGGLQACEDR